MHPSCFLNPKGIIRLFIESVKLRALLSVEKFGPLKALKFTATLCGYRIKNLNIIFKNLLWKLFLWL